MKTSGVTMDLFHLAANIRARWRTCQAATLCLSGSDTFAHPRPSTRYLRHVHVGSYQALPRKWKDLKTELAARGEIIDSPALEVYGHHCEDPDKLETTILIGLQTKPA